MTKKLRLLPGLIALVLAAGACGDPGSDDNGIATAGGAGASPSASAGAASGLSDDERRLKFAECMREQGIDMPDPGEGGAGERVRIRVGEGTSPEEVEAAMEACKQYAPNGGEPIKLNPEQLEQARKFSRCMRENGVPEFPDPDPEGIRLRAGRGTGIDPDSEEFKAAQETCRQYRPQLRPSSGAAR